MRFSQRRWRGVAELGRQTRPYLMTRISDTEFDETLTLRQAFDVLRSFIEQFNERGPQEIDVLASWLDLQADGRSADPAQLGDFLINRTACALRAPAASRRTRWAAEMENTWV